MGVSGAGKTFIGRKLAERLGWEFADADDYHPPENVAKMSAGTPLDDADRAPWLVALHGLLRDSPGPLVLACSALKETYRDTLRGELNGIAFVYLDAPAAAIRERLEQRKGHYMPAALLDSQFAALEVPAAALKVDALLGPEEITEVIMTELGLDAG